MALVRGIDGPLNKEDSELASARDAIWLARRSLEENNPAQALVNLAVAGRRLRVYREVLSQDQRQEVDQMLREVDHLEDQLRQEGNRQVSQRRADPPGPHADRLVGQDQRLVQAASLIGHCPVTRPRAPVETGAPGAVRCRNERAPNPDPNWR